MVGPDFQVRPEEATCQWNAYCLGACRPDERSEGDCRGVVAVGPEPDDPADDPRETCEAGRRWCLNKAVARGRQHLDLLKAVPRLKFVTWDRDNSVKHALSLAAVPIRSVGVPYG